MQIKKFEEFINECCPPINAVLLLQNQLPENYIATDEVPDIGDEFVALDGDNGLKRLNIYVAEKIEDQIVFTSNGNSFINYTRKVIKNNLK